MSNKRKSIQVIQDSLLEPYFITRDEYSFAVKQNIEPDADHFKTTSMSKSYEKTLGYYSTFEKALEKVSKFKLDTKEYTKLKDYLKDYKQISNQIKTYTDGIKSQV